MSLFKKSQEETLFSKQIGEKTVYKLRYEWNTKKAIMEYGLYEATEVSQEDGSKGIRVPIQMESKYPDGWHFLSAGDTAWAERTARHYGIKMPS